jgi:hypothetical protein
VKALKKHLQNSDAKYTLSKHECGTRSPGHFKTIRGYERELKTPTRALFPDIFID